ncbi:barstar family protein [Devosia sp. A16]|uniref:barstar family protein n=1 Tax=Devosia sp. A16 TaxID=1736675 RepID=UPI0006D820FB|nr:barstar family protein [Devosia sp. A16]
MAETLSLTLDGAAITDIPSFYDEVNRVFMAGEDWRLGPSPDALDDLLHGSFGALHGIDRVVLIWTDIEQSRLALGVEATRRHYLAKLAQPTRFDVDRIAADLAALERGDGPTYFDIILEIIAGHPQIELRPA